MSERKLPVFPFEPDGITESTFVVLERGDLLTSEDVKGVIQTLFYEPECPIYYYRERGLPIDTALLSAEEHGDIVMRRNEIRHYRHPIGERIFIRIIGRTGKYESKVEKDIVERGPEFVRTQLELSTVKRLEMEAWLKVQMEARFREQLLKEKYQYDVFLSYSDADRDEAAQLYAAIDEAGGRAFMAPKVLSPGVDFADEIRTALENSRELWLIVSPTSIGSEWVTSEWGAAWVLRKRIVPILHRCKPEDLPDRIRKLHCTDFYKYRALVEEAFRKLEDGP